MALPSLSVLISTYNDRDLVHKKMAEIRRQTIFSEVEFIFIETASPQKERELLRPLCDENANCKLVTTDSRESLFAAWNRGWQLAPGDWVCYSNMDDSMHPKLLEILRNSIARHDWDLCGVLIAKQDEHAAQRDSWAPSHLSKLALSTRPGPFTAWRNDLRLELGEFEGAFISAGDKDFWSRAIARKLKVGLVPKVLYLYTTGADQLSKQGVPATDQALMDAQPYPMLWPGKYRLQTKFWSPVLRVAPNLVVPDISALG
jgi:glycosyltransferase involved in cell wall biosynthesis